MEKVNTHQNTLIEKGDWNNSVAVLIYSEESSNCTCIQRDNVIIERKMEISLSRGDKKLKRPVCRSVFVRTGCDDLTLPVT